MQFRRMQLCSIILTLSTALTALADEPQKLPVAPPTVTPPVAPASAGLTLVGKGVRSKKVVFFNVNVYEAQFYVSDQAKFTGALASSTPLDALALMEAAELRLKFMRSLSAAQIKESFLDALDANKVNRKSPSVAAFLKKIVESPSFDEGKGIVLTADFKAGTLRYVDPAGKGSFMQVNAQDIRDVFSIWLGNPADAGLESLKNALIGKTK